MKIYNYSCTTWGALDSRFFFFYIAVSIEDFLASSRICGFVFNSVLEMLFFFFLASATAARWKKSLIITYNVKMRGQIQFENFSNYRKCIYIYIHGFFRRCEFTVIMVDEQSHIGLEEIIVQGNSLKVQDCFREV